MHVQTKLLYRVISTHFWLGVTRKWRPMVLFGSLNLPLGAKGETCRGILGGCWGACSSDPWRFRFFCFLSFSPGVGCSTRKGHSAQLSSCSVLGRLRGAAMVNVGGGSRGVAIVRSREEKAGKGLKGAVLCSNRTRYQPQRVSAYRSQCGRRNSTIATRPRFVARKMQSPNCTTAKRREKPGHGKGKTRVAGMKAAKEAGSGDGGCAR